MKKTLAKSMKWLAKIPGAKAVFRFLFKGYFNRCETFLIEQKAGAYHNYGLEALAKFDECLRANNIPYTLAFGSILGAIRNQGFIKHDLDIDTFMWIEDFNPKIIQELQKYGFTWLYNYSVSNDKDGREDTFEYKGVGIDIFYIYPKINEHPYCCDFVQEKGMKKNERLARRLEMPISKDRKTVKFETLQLDVPANAEEICEFRYGPNYMIPDPSWNWENEKTNVVEWRDKIAKTTRTKYPTL